MTLFENRETAIWHLSDEQPRPQLNPGIYCILKYMSLIFSKHDDINLHMQQFHIWNKSVLNTTDLLATWIPSTPQPINHHFRQNLAFVRTNVPRNRCSCHPTTRQRFVESSANGCRKNMKKSGGIKSWVPEQRSLGNGPTLCENSKWIEWVGWDGFSNLVALPQLIHLGRASEFSIPKSYRHISLD